jgi:hypothetical protein
VHEHILAAAIELNAFIGGTGDIVNEKTRPADGADFRKVLRGEMQLANDAGEWLKRGCHAEVAFGKGRRRGLFADGPVRRLAAYLRN